MLTVFVYLSTNDPADVNGGNHDFKVPADLGVPRSVSVLLDLFEDAELSLKT